MEFKKWAVQPTSEPGSARSNLNSSRSRVVSRLMTARDQEMSGSKEKLSESFSMSHESSLQQEPIYFSEEKNLASTVGASQHSDGRVDTRNSRWLVPQPEIQEDEVKKNFDPDTVNSSVVTSPLRPIKVYLRIGLLVGAFPADVGERYIHYFFEFCDGRTWYVMLVLLLWMLGGVGLIVYCLISSTTSTFVSIFQSKTTWTWMSMTSTDQLVLLSIPAVSLIFIPLLIGMSWSRINSLSEICENFVTNGYRVGFTPSNRTMSALAYRIVIFLVGQSLMNIHVALVFCDTTDKQILLSVLLVVWQLPLYIAVTFGGYILLQFIHTITEYFMHLRSDVIYKNESLSRSSGERGEDGEFYNKVLKLGGLPKRLDRLIDGIRHLQVVYGPLLFYEFILYIYLLICVVYMSFAIIINSFKTNTQQAFPPWWILGYLILSIHHYMRLSMFCHAGDHLRRELFKTLTLISQFGFVQNDTALLALAIARKPDQLLTVGGYCRLDRTCLTKILFLVLLAVIAISNFKLYEFKTP